MKLKKVLDNLFKFEGDIFSNAIKFIFFTVFMAIVFVSLQMDHSGWNNFQIIVWAFLLIIVLYIAFFNMYFQLKGIFTFIASYYLLHLILCYNNINLPIIIFQILVVSSIIFGFVYTHIYRIKEKKK